MVDEIYKFSGRCSATVNVGLDDELLENYCEDVEDLEDVEFVEVIAKEYDEKEIPNELDIDESDIGEILSIYI